MSDPKAELAVKKLARLPTNTTCPNCGQSKKLGFSNVCIKFYTFVCNDCKSSHQAYSHRCKSLTMSSWSAEEAKALKQNGNEVARRTWLANAPPIGVGGRPKQGDSLPVFKQFILNAYEHKKYYGQAQEVNVGMAVPEQDVTSIPAKSSKKKTGSFAAPLRAPPKSSQDFASFSQSASKPKTDASTSNFASFPPATAAPASTPVPDLFAQEPVVTPAPTNEAVFDPFGNSDAPKKTEGADVFGAATTKDKDTNVSDTTSGGFAYFDPFGNSSAVETNNADMSRAGNLADLSTPAQKPAVQPKQSVMNDNSGSKISAMGYFMKGSSGQQQQQQQQQHNNMVFQTSFGNSTNMSFGMNTQMNSGGMTPQQVMMMQQQQQQQMNMMQRQQMNMGMMQQQQPSMSTMQQQQFNMNMMPQQTSMSMMQQQPVMSMGSSTGATISAMTPQTNQQTDTKDPFASLF